jgi:glutamate synthase domain-containing protein 2
MPKIIHAIIKRPKHCRTQTSFESLLYTAKQMTRTAEKQAGIHQEFFFSSLSSVTIVYKALCTGEDLPRFYLDLQNPEFKTNFAIFHRRFSTNTISSWDKVQPFRLIAHNGEINTIEGNKAWSITREKALGLRKDELITHEGISDSGSLNGIVEALKYRSSIPKTSEILSILMPPAKKKNSYYNFWSRGMEPWDGPALVVFCDGKTVGARLDRNGLRPCRWSQTKDFFYLCSETGSFVIDESKVIEKGALSSGGSVTINHLNGSISFLDSSKQPDNIDAYFEAQLTPLDYYPPTPREHNHINRLQLFQYSKEDIETFIDQIITEKKEPIGSMGDTARLAFLSDQSRSLFDFFYQDFAQVTNPPLDYIREKAVTDMRAYLGRKPNIFEPKEFIPPKPILMVDGPVLSLGQLEHIKKNNPIKPSIRVIEFQTTFPKESNAQDFLSVLNKLTEKSIEAVKSGHTILILSDRSADEDNLPIPSILALRAISLGLNRSGIRLRTSIIIDSGDVKNAHHLACLLGFGASIVCPYLLLERAYYGNQTSLQHIFPIEREKRVIDVLNSGVLRIMAKMGISVLRSYQGSQLFSIVGLGQDVLDYFFPNVKSVVGGLSLDSLLDKIKQNSDSQVSELKKSFIFKEHPTGKLGETHALTSARSKIIHKLIQSDSQDERDQLFTDFKNQINDSACFIRHLMAIDSKRPNLSLTQVCPEADILKTFGSGGMSFGAISAESQKDLILAFREIQGRSNSGEGGENPFYYTDGITSTVKQIASGRFGVTSEYLINAEEVQIKIAQGAKPGEGGQLMGVKVTTEIAKARFSTAGVDLISPPPQHDIYSIEDLKELIYELKQLKPALKVSVKLVSGKNIGAIAVGVVKAGADIIQISGGDGGTGAASLLSMKHAGLPLEIGLLEVHHSLMNVNLRDRVLLRADGGLMTGKDIVMAALLGADQFDFGKIILVPKAVLWHVFARKILVPRALPLTTLSSRPITKATKKNW